MEGIVRFFWGGVMLLGFSCVLAHADVVGAGKTVAFDYTLTVKDAEVETTKGKEPLEFRYGKGEILPGLEQKMEGMAVGETRTIAVPEALGYGPRRGDAVRSLSRTELPAGFVPREGAVLNVEDAEGGRYRGVIVKVSDEDILLDFNPPLAGQDLLFDVTVVSVK
ncbi:MAG: hypothetical protein GX606_02365 [Elusimicrobia bacterium]|nr:hypothetical protein [Elusimicrobiota bacterium]